MSVAIDLETSTLHKEKTLRVILSQLGKVAVCFSGGIDSSVLLLEAIDVLGEANVLAVMARSPLVIDDDIKFANDLIQSRPAMKKLFFDRGEMEYSEFLTNDEKRCYYCKQIFFKKAKSLIEKHNFEHVLDGTNSDDVNDYRPGMLASSENGIRSPLKEAHLRKNEIRILAKKLGISDTERQSSSCYATRIPYYEPITFQRIDMISRGESFLKSIGFKTVRLRYHGDLAKIEIDENDFALIMNKKTRDEICVYMKSIGFAYTSLDIAGYRKGSMNETLK